MAPPKDFYSVLGVASTATADEIKKSYRRLAKRYHPDANPNDPKAAERFKEVSEAYQVISDPEKRKQYDDMRRYGAFTESATGARERRTSTRQTGEQNFQWQNFDIGGLGGLGDLFSSMFGGSGGPRGNTRGRAPEDGHSVEMTLDIPFRVAALGGKVPVEIEVTEECPVCRGSGAAPGASIKVCPECSGRGVVSFGQGGFAVNRPCPMCMGRGQVPTERCGNCGGSGEVRSKKRLEIAVPPGADTGTRVQLRGQGGRGSAGARPGDLVITFQVQPDHFYKREGLDLVAPVRLNIAQATLGSKIRVTTLDNKRVTVRIPPGTQPGRRFRVRGQGIAKGERRGDLIIEATLVVPEKLSDDEERMMREFAAAKDLKF